MAASRMTTAIFIRLFSSSWQLRISVGAVGAYSMKYEIMTLQAIAGGYLEPEISRVRLQVENPFAATALEVIGMPAGGQVVQSHELACFENLSDGYALTD